MRIVIGFNIAGYKVKNHTHLLGYFLSVLFLNRLQFNRRPVYYYFMTFETTKPRRGRPPKISQGKRDTKAELVRSGLEQLTENGWNINENPKIIEVEKGKMNIANTNARVVLQSFSRESIIKIESKTF